MDSKETWVVLDYFVGIYCGMGVITRTTKTQLITKTGVRFHYFNAGLLFGLQHATPPEKPREGFKPPKI